MKYSWIVTSFVLMASTASGQSAALQNMLSASAERTVSGSGSVTVKQMPTIMRMTVQFKETGKGLPEALKNLKDRQAAAKAVVVRLGAKNESIHVGTPSIPADDPQAAQQMAMMNARQGGGKKKKATATKVTIVGSLSVEWALPNGSPEELLLFVHDLKDKVQAADISGQKEQKKLSAEEQEEKEEMEMMQAQYGGGQQAKPGEPSYLFLAKISAEAQQKARAAAFQKARTQAEQLADAAGGKLGKLRSLQKPGENADRQMMFYYRQQNAGAEADSDEGGESDDEGLGKSPICVKIAFTFDVQATFDIDP